MNYRSIGPLPQGASQEGFVEACRAGRIKDAQRVRVRAREPIYWVCSEEAWRTRLPPGFCWKTTTALSLPPSKFSRSIAPKRVLPTDAALAQVRAFTAPPATPPPIPVRAVYAQHRLTGELLGPFLPTAEKSGMNLARKAIGKAKGYAFFIRFYYPPSEKAHAQKPE